MIRLSEIKARALAFKHWKLKEGAASDYFEGPGPDFEKLLELVEIGMKALREIAGTPGIKSHYDGIVRARVALNEMEMALKAQFDSLT